MNREPATSAFVLPACHGPMALVLRRGPSKWWHFLLWNRDSGEVVHGSWFFGIIYPHFCDLSPKGDWMVILAYRGSKKPHAWTALCRAPNVHAHAFWPQETAKSGGGYFDERLPIVWINLPDQTVEVERHESHPFDFGFQDADTPFYGVPTERLQRDGWKFVKPRKKGENPTWRMAGPDGKRWLWREFAGSLEDLQADSQLLFSDKWAFSVSAKKEGEDRRPLAEASWAGWNRAGEICVAESGVLKTRDFLDLVERRVVCDLRQLKPPEARSVRKDPPLEAANP